VKLLKTTLLPFLWFTESVLRGKWEGTGLGRKKDFEKLCLGCIRRHPRKVKSPTIKFNSPQFQEEEESKQPRPCDRSGNPLEF